MKEIKLSQQGKNKGKYVALVDDEDYEAVNKFRWCAQKHDNLIYAIRNIIINDSKTTEKLHQFILCGKFIDHIDNNGLNCQKLNLRFATIRQNIMNKRPDKNTSSKYKGVCFEKRYKNYCATIMINGKNKNLGRYKNEIEAAKVYDRKAREIFGEFAYLNFK